MKCPYCEADRDRVVDSRARKGGRAIRRRRECLECGKRFTTYEYVESTPLRVIKRDGRSEPYERQKLQDGIVTACAKRPVRLEAIERIVDEIEHELSRLDRREVTSKTLGETVMRRLQQLDRVAYVRFASVYRKFRDTDEFMEEIRGLEEAAEETERWR